MSKLNRVTVGKSQGFEDSSFVLLGLIRGSDRGLILQADLTSITYNVTDLSDDSNPVESDTLTISDVILDTVVTDDIAWLEDHPGDTIGYNFELQVPKTWGPDPDRTYKIELVFQPTTGAAYEFVVVHEHTTLPLSSS